MIELQSIVRINPNSRIPKYQQIVNSIIEDIDKGILIIGDRIPSINDISEEFYLSRDTVEKAYNQLKKKKVIVPVKGKGYYVAQAVSQSQVKILFFLNKLSNYKLKIYNSFINSLGNDAKVDLKIYHCDSKLFLNTLQENLGAYDYYVVMPHFKDKSNLHLTEDVEIIDMLKKIPSEKLVIMDNFMPSLGHDVAAIYQDFHEDIYRALKEGADRLRKYDKLILVHPECALYPYPEEIKTGFQKFCQKYEFDYEVIPRIFPEMELESQDAYITIEENDLVCLIKQMRDRKLKPGKDIGIISYNDTKLKELLGITVISTDFRVMGETAAYMIKKKKSEVVKNVFNFIDRGSI
ncbi:GntR family transcriptional regulator [Anditalea andensis]|uniref:Transcriptional regulator n=1 Tax=Anditalea andensis TaxID=1048983 RepID=A0A074LP62_9BACT|nr:GntR family transcriptional regulator [Anditalea andensis]KEO75697.1 transcriptional regulator [Anditalea andensis]